MLYFFLSYCGIYPLQGVLPSNRAVALVSPPVLDEAVQCLCHQRQRQCLLGQASLRHNISSFIILVLWVWNLNTYIIKRPFPDYL